MNKFEEKIIREILARPLLSGIVTGLVAGGAEGLFYSAARMSQNVFAPLIMLVPTVVVPIFGLRLNKLRTGSFRGVPEIDKLIIGITVGTAIPAAMLYASNQGWFSAIARNNALSSYEQAIEPPRPEDRCCYPTHT